ncbi:MAG: hypothetical protein OEW37_00090 [Rhodospirillaceae bacterium]|nr:hypothetical protein [Rhodospirillaceae bacterium]
MTNQNLLAPASNPVARAVKNIKGGYSGIARLCGVTPAAVMRWASSGMPRTESTGETNYSVLIAAALPGIVSEQELRESRRLIKLALKAG